MKIAVCLFVYEMEKHLIVPALESIRRALTSYSSKGDYQIVIVDDAINPLPGKIKKEFGQNVILKHSTVPRMGNLRSWTWFVEQADILASIDCEVVIKVDPDVLINYLGPFMIPFEKGFKGMVGVPRGKMPAIGACYAIHKEGLALLKQDIRDIWNAPWMDAVMSYMKAFSPSFGGFLPAQEDAIMSAWFKERNALISLPEASITEFDWEHYKATPSYAIMLGNPGPKDVDAASRKIKIGELLRAGYNPGQIKK